jgi:hypothetical protein
MRKVFISYAHSDSDEVARFVKALKNQDIVGWLDQADLSAGEAIPSAVRSALERSSALIVLLSPHALQSQWVQFEIGAAEALGKKIVPVILSGDFPGENVPEILRNRVWVDARDRAYEDVVRDLQHAVESLSG